MGLRRLPLGIVSRRELLLQSGAGFASLVLSALEGRHSLQAATPDQEKTRPPAKAKAVIFLFCYGGPSQIDLFDPKPQLARWVGKSLPNAPKSAEAFPSPFRFQKHGQAGLEISELFPHVAEHADKLCLLRAVQSDSRNHAPALFQMNTGFTRPGYPCFGSWTTYGLGNANEDLPAFVVMLDPRGGPIGGPQNWSAGFLPANFQATMFRSTGEPLVDLFPPAHLDRETLSARRKLLDRLNADYLERHPDEAEFAARVASYELAFRMQMAAPQVTDLSQEPQSIRTAYGLDEPETAPFGRQCLLARRLVQRGVRFVQIYSGGGLQQTSWDAHVRLSENHRQHCLETDKPIAALLADLEAQGLLESTLVIWGGEFGRSPIAQQQNGRDHHPDGFTMCLAGGGIKGGKVFGSTDELGMRAVENIVTIPDLHATCLHQLGLDHRELTYLHEGRQARLTDVRGRVLHEILS